MFSVSFSGYEPQPSASNSNKVGLAVALNQLEQNSIKIYLLIFSVFIANAGLSGHKYLIHNETFGTYL